MDRIERLTSFLSDVMNPCRIPPNGEQPISFTSSPRTRISRSQVLAIGVMSITMIGILVALSAPIIIWPTHIPMKYNTESLIVKFNDNGVSIWDVRLPIANATGKTLFKPDSIRIVRCGSEGYVVASPILCQKNETKTWGVLLCRIDDFGKLVWEHVFDELDIELDLSLAEVQTEGFVVAGTARSYDEESNSWVRRTFLLRTDNSGEQQWFRNHSELIGVWTHSLVQCANGDFAIAGTSDIYSEEEGNMILARFDADGTFLWKRSIGGPLKDEGNSLLECSDGSFIVVGSTQIKANDKDVLIARTTANGSLIWNCTYEDEGISIGLSVCSMDNGEFVVTGLRKSSIMRSFKTLFLVVGPDGEEITRESLYYDSEIYPYGYYNDCRGHVIVRSNDDGLIIAGMVQYNHLIDEWGMMILRTDASGNLISNSTYGVNAWHMACSITTCENPGFVVAGVRISPVR